MKRFKLPVLYVDYDVLFQKAVRHKGKAVHGLCDVSKRIIRIETKPNMELMRQVIWHEFGHALHWELGQVIDGEDESVTDHVATAIMIVRQRVPWL